MGVTDWVFALAVGHSGPIRAIFPCWRPRELRDGPVVWLDDTAVFPLASRSVSRVRKLLVDSPRRWLVGGPDVCHLLLGEFPVSPVFTVVPFEGFGDDLGVPSGMDPRDNIFDLLVVVLAILNHLEIRHDDMCACVDLGH